MKKNIKIMALFAVLLTLTLCVFLTSCMEEEFHAVYFASSGGSIVGDISQYVKKGKDATEVTAVANEGFRFTEWSDGLKDAARQDKAITAEVKVTAKFEALEIEDEDNNPTIDPQTEPKGEIVPDEDMPTSEDVLYFSELPPSVSDGTYRVSLSPRIDKASVKSIVIPATHNGKPVAVIETSAFMACPNLEYVYIPSSIKIISPNAFSYCGRLKTINIPNSVMSISKEAFRNCGKLESINIPDSVVSDIGNFTFSGCKSLSSIHIPASVKNIGFGAFSGCTGLKTVEMAGVETIGQVAFSNCNALESVYLPSTLEYVYGYAFQNSSNNAVIYAAFGEGRTAGWHSLWNYKFYGRISYEGGATEPIFRPEVEAEFSFRLLDNNTYEVSLHNRQYKVISAVVPEIYNGLPVTAIMASGFGNSEFLEEVYIPASVTSIGTNAFVGCSKLRTVEMVGVKTIGRNAFVMCKALETVYLSESLELISSDAFRYTKPTIYAPFDKERTANWASGWDNMFVGTILYNGTNPAVEEAEFSFRLKDDNTYAISVVNKTAYIKSVTIPETYNGIAVTEIDTQGFAYMRYLEAVYIPASITVLSDRAFYECYRLRTVEMANVEKIGIYCFINCFALEEVFLSSNLEEFGNLAFSLRNVTDVFEVVFLTIYSPFDEEKTLSLGNWGQVYDFAIVYNFVGK